MHIYSAKVIKISRILQLELHAIACGFAKDPPRFGLVQGGEIGHVDAQALGRDLADRPREPESCPEEPGAKSPRGDDADGDGGVVERLLGHRVGRGQAEDDADEADPEHAHDGDGPGHESEPERTAPEVGGAEESDEDGDAVGDVQADGGDGGRGREGHGGTERGECEAEGERGGEPDGADRGLEAGVDFAEKWGETWGAMNSPPDKRKEVLTSVPTEAVHHAGV